MGGKAVPQPVQRHALPDPGRPRRLMEQPVQLARARRLAALAAWKQKPFLRRRSGIVWRGAHLPPLAQESERVARQHDMPILAPLALLDANDLLRGIDMLDLQPHHLAGAQPAAVSEAEHHAGLEAAGHPQQALHLVLLITSGSFSGSRMW